MKKIYFIQNVYSFYENFPQAFFCVQGYAFPSTTGYPMSTPTSGPKYYRLEIHYDNPGMTPFNDSSGVSLQFTTTPRRRDLGLLEAGLTYGPLQMIPPGQPSFTSVGFCSSQCTRAAMPREGINIIGLVLHSHLLGKF
jgi:hypothetical protein